VNQARDDGDLTPSLARPLGTLPTERATLAIFRRNVAIM
jgi:hypothetical protein